MQVGVIDLPPPGSPIQVPSTAPPPILPIPVPSTTTTEATTTTTTVPETTTTSTATPGPLCVDFVCEDGYLLRENPEARPGNDRETCCYREGVCAGAPIGSPCSLGDIDSSLVPNPSFEEFTSCPTSISQLDRAVTWVQATDATSDYWVGAPRCSDGWRSGLGGIGGIPQQATDGDAIVGSIKGSSYFEYIGACLTSPLLAGVEYTFNLDVAAATNSGSYGGDTNGVTELLCIPDCGDFRISGSDWKGDDFEILATATPAGGLLGGGEWKSITFQVTPSQDCPAIMFGPGLAQSIQIGQSGTYVLYDFLNLQAGAAGVCDDKGECVPVTEMPVLGGAVGPDLAGLDVAAFYSEDAMAPYSDGAAGPAGT